MFGFFLAVRININRLMQSRDASDLVPDPVAP